MIGRDTHTEIATLLSNRGDLHAEYGSRAHFHIRLFIFAEDTSNICHGGCPIRRVLDFQSRLKASQDALYYCPSSVSKVSSRKGIQRKPALLDYSAQKESALQNSSQTLEFLLSIYVPSSPNVIRIAAVTDYKWRCHLPFALNNKVSTKIE